jgi:hypothetical protein
MDEYTYYYTDGDMFWTIDYDKEKEYTFPTILINRFPKPTTWRACGTGFEEAYDYAKNYQKFLIEAPKLLLKYTSICDSLILIILEYSKEVKLNFYVSHAICGN